MAPTPHRHGRSARRTTRSPIRPQVARLVLLMATLAAPAGPPTSVAHAASPSLHTTTVTSSPGQSADRGRDAPDWTPPAAGSGDQRTFGVQPSGATKPDHRPSFTYRGLHPGQVARDHVAIVNVSERPAVLTVYPADAYTSGGGAFDVLPAGKTSRDVGAWVRLPRRSVTVPARSSLILPFTLSVPRTAEPGDHAGGIVASIRSVSKDARGNTVSVDQRVGARVYVRVAGALRPSLELTDYSVHYTGTANPVGGGHVSVAYVVRNTGNVRLVGHQTLRTSLPFGIGGRSVDVPDLPELLPGASYAVQVPVDGVPPAFVVTARATIDPVSVSGNVDPALQGRSQTAWAPAMPWLLLAMLVVAVGTWWWRRRRGRPTRDAPQTVWESSMRKSQEGAPAGMHAFLRGPRSGRSALPAVALAAVAMLVAAADPASAGAEGTLTFIPGTGLSVSPLYAVTSGPCPAEAESVVGTLTGAGFPPDGITVIANGPASMSRTEAFGVPLQDTLSGFAASSGITLSGPYIVRVSCINRLGTQVYARFTGTIRFKDRAHFAAPAPKAPVSNLSVGVQAQVFPPARLAAAPAPGEAPRRASTTPSRPVVAPTGGIAATAASAPAALAAESASVPRDAPGTVPWPLILAVGLVLVLVGVGPALRRHLPRARGRALSEGAGASTLAWPDEPAAGGDR